jgi:hypothetical protein
MRPWVKSSRGRFQDHTFWRTNNEPRGEDLRRTLLSPTGLYAAEANAFSVLDRCELQALERRRSWPTLSGRAGYGRPSGRGE